MARKKMTVNLKTGKKMTVAQVAKSNKRFIAKEQRKDMRAGGYTPGEDGPK